MKAQLIVRKLLTIVVCSASICIWARPVCGLGQERPPTAAGEVSKAVGKVKSVASELIVVTTDNGADMNVQLNDSSRVLRVEPGQKDLKAATSAHLQDVQPGDRLLARGIVSADGKSMLAATVIVMKAGDVSAKQEQEREDWKANGIGGLVSAVDPNAQFVTISMQAVGGTKTIKVDTTKDTIVRKYAPDSIKFDDAKPAALADVKVGDQLRARGALNADKTGLSAQEVVFGTFRNIAGTVVSSDPGKSTLIVNDLATKKPLTLVTSPDSQLRKLPPMVAQRIAMRLKGSTPSASAAAGSDAASGATAKPPEGRTNGDGAARAGGQGDFQQMLARMPAVTLADLQKGDAVMIVSTEGTASELPRAITLLSGVEPILSASPDSSRAAMLLSPWNLGGAGGAGEGGGPNP
jgi:hypothetical protein